MIKQNTHTTQSLTMFKTIIATLFASVYAININATAGDPCSHATSAQEYDKCMVELEMHETELGDCGYEGIRYTQDGWERC